MSQCFDMPDWTPPNEPDARPAFSGIVPHNVLYQIDGEPIIFTVLNNRHMMFCYKISSSGDCSKYLISPTNDVIISGVKNGDISVRDAVRQAWQWLIEASDENFEVLRSWTVDAHVVPEAILPKEGVPLFYRHRRIKPPYLSIKYSGGHSDAGLLPFGVIRNAVDDVYTSLVKIFISATQHSVIGWTESRIRRALEIPTHQMVHSSLIIAIEKPFFNIEPTEIRSNPEQLALNIENARDKFLQSAFIIAKNIENKKDIVETASEHLEALEALSRIMPSQQGFFETVEIDGRRTDEVGQPVVIESRNAKLIRETFAAASSTMREFTGEVFLINGGSHQFTMMVQERQITCVATSEAQQDEVDMLKKGDSVFVRGEFKARSQRDLIYMRVMRKSDGLTVT